MKHKNKKEWIYALLCCFLVSFLFLMVASKSSFLYHLNDWMDANCFFTVGKGMLHGKVPYLDLFDQKGPLLFFIHMIGAMISYDTFLGIYMLEVISFTIFLYYGYKLSRLFLNHFYAMGLIPILATMTLILPAFSHGDSAEEFCLPILMFSLYSLTRYLKEKKIAVPSYRMLFINGIMAGLVFTIKYTITGFWIAFILCLFFHILFQKKYRRAFLSGFVFLGGMLLPIIPWILYFSYHHALGAFIDGYFLFNLKYLPHDISPLLKGIMVIQKPIRFYAQNLGIGLSTMIGLYAIWKNKKHFPRKEMKIILTLSLLFLCLGVFGGGISFRYYYLILVPFSIYGLIELATWHQSHYHPKWMQDKGAILTILVTLCFTFCFFGTKNTNLLKFNKPKDSYVQYQFSEIINQKKNPKILNYLFLDGGFYTTSKTLPNTKYFQKQNIDNEIFPDIKRAQDRVIRKQQVDFVITRELEGSHRMEENRLLNKYYKIKKTGNQTYEEKRYHYILWKVRSNPV